MAKPQIDWGARQAAILIWINVARAARREIAMLDGFMMVLGVGFFIVALGYAAACDHM